ncbi:MAG: 6-phosphogluconolactonase, partial [Gammaproteobacteria bacterium]
MNSPEKPILRPHRRVIEPPEPDAAKLKLHIFRNAEIVAQQAAAFIAEHARQMAKLQDRFVLALSGGATPRQMFKQLAIENMPWDRLHIVQTDERVAPAGDAARNFSLLQANFLTHNRVRPQQIYPMPVEMHDLKMAARNYAGVLEHLGGSPPVLDLVHLGLGADGHTASLVPGDPVLHAMDADVALTDLYQGHRRMTLTYPIISRARCILWLVTGSAKSDMLARLYNDDTTIPAGRIARDRAVVFADQAAAVRLETSTQ